MIRPNFNHFLNCCRWKVVSWEQDTYGCSVGVINLIWEYRLVIRLINLPVAHLGWGQAEIRKISSVLHRCQRRLEGGPVLLHTLDLDFQLFGSDLQRRWWWRFLFEGDFDSSEDGVDFVEIPDVVGAALALHNFSQNDLRGVEWSMV